MKIYSVMTKFEHVYISTLEKSHEWVTDYLKNVRTTDFTIFENNNQYAMKKEI